MRRSMSCGAYTFSIVEDYSCRRTAAASRPHRGRIAAVPQPRRAPPASVPPASRRSALGALDEEIGEQRRRPSGAAFLRAALVGGAGDVQMRPGHSLGELAEEAGRGDGAAVAAADVGEVGKVALELVEVFLGERQLPAAVFGAYPGLEQLLHERIVVAQEPRMMMAERHYAGAGEGGDVDHRRGAEAPRVMQRIAQDQAPLGVGVEDLDRLARGAGGDVAGLYRLAVRHVL